MTINLKMFGLNSSVLDWQICLQKSVFTDRDKPMHLKPNLQLIWKILYMEQFINILRCYSSILGSQNQFPYLLQIYPLFLTEKYLNISF